MPSKQTIPERVREFLGSRIRPPVLVQNPETGEPMLESATYSFREPYADEFERIARAASEASGIVPSVEDLNAEAMAVVQQAAAERQ